MIRVLTILCIPIKLSGREWEIKTDKNSSRARHVHDVHLPLVDES